MNKKVKDLIKKYEMHLKQGDKIARKLKHLGQENTLESQHQRAINSIWRMFLKDLADIADMDIYDDHSKK